MGGPLGRAAAAAPVLGRAEGEAKLGRASNILGLPEATNQRNAPETTLMVHNKGALGLIGHIAVLVNNPYWRKRTAVLGPGRTARASASAGQNPKKDLEQA